MKLLRRSMLLLAMVMAACGGGDDGDGPAGIDAANACALPSATTSCTEGDNTPCTALCEQSYCHNFAQLPTPVCTHNCPPGDNTACPSGWTCNGMGRCRPPDP